MGRRFGRKVTWVSFLVRQPVTTFFLDCCGVLFLQGVVWCTLNAEVLVWTPAWPRTINLRRPSDNEEEEEGPPTTSETHTVGPRPTRQDRRYVERIDHGTNAIASDDEPLVPKQRHVKPKAIEASTVVSEQQQPLQQNEHTAPTAQIVPNQIPGVLRHMATMNQEEQRRKVAVLEEIGLTGPAVNVVISFVYIAVTTTALIATLLWLPWAMGGLACHLFTAMVCPLLNDSAFAAFAVVGAELTGQPLSSLMLQWDAPRWTDPTLTISTLVRPTLRIICTGYWDSLY